MRNNSVGYGLHFTAAFGVPGKFLPANPRRRGFVLSAPVSATVHIGTSADPIQDGGLRVPIGTAPVVVCCCDYGNWVQKQLYYATSGGGEEIYVVDVIDTDEEV